MKANDYQILVEFVRSKLNTYPLLERQIISKLSSGLNKIPIQLWEYTVKEIIDSLNTTIERGEIR